MLRRSTPLAITTVIAGALLTTVPATALSETCQGRPATIVGTGPDLVGTPGDDVIVTGASTIARAEAGDDLICVTGSGSGDVYVYAGEGDDVVDASETTRVTRTWLDSGLDGYLGGRGYGEVYANGADDIVSGGDGMEWIVLDVTSAVEATVGHYDGGSGFNTISVWSETLDLEVDLDEQVVVDGAPAANITKFSSAHLVAPRGVLRGNAEENSLGISGCDVQVSGEGGDDNLRARRAGGAAPTFECDLEAKLTGGSGDDRIYGSKGRDRIIGNAGDDRLDGRSAADMLFGGAGQDRLVGGGGPDVLHGNGGDDTMIGYPGNDTLRGHGGRDIADGHHGRDNCVAERQRRCEG